MARPSSTTQDHPLLAKPLYVFRLPEEIASTLELHSSLDAPTTALPLDEHNARLAAQDEEQSSIATEAGAKAKSCALCTLTFATLEEQREHFKSDRHRYNLKQKLHGLAPVDEEEFDRRIEALDESLSGSDSSENSSNEDSEDDADERKSSSLTALLRKQASIAPVDQDAEPGSKKHKRGAGKHPIIWLTSDRLPPSTVLGVYRAIFSEQDAADSTSLVKVLQQKQIEPRPSKTSKSATNDEDDGGVPLTAEIHHKPINGPHYFLCMIGGGHFAAMIIDLTPTVTKQGVDDRSVNVVAHKTFHRYTTRRKQGGSQSANDNSKGNAHSAGSSLRRYNEAALTTDIRNLLADWKPWIATSDLLFIRATGTTNRRSLFGPYDGQVLTSRDSRIRGFPFATRRATQAELIRSFVELTRVKISSVEELNAARNAAEEANRARQEAAVPKAQPSPKPAKQKPSKEEEEALLHTSQLQSLIRRSKAPGLISYITTNNIDPDLTFVPADRPEHHHAPTPLHLAASLNSAPCVSALLTKVKANPAIRNGEGKSAVELAGDRATRDAFRLARQELGEEAFAWEEAGVGSPLTKEQVEARAKSDKAEADAEKSRETERRKAEVDRLRKEDQEKEDATREKKVGKGRVLGEKPVPLSAEERRAEEERGMTPEMRMRLERERRARAAEARLGMR